MESGNFLPKDVSQSSFYIELTLFNVMRLIYLIQRMGHRPLVNSGLDTGEDIKVKGVHVNYCQYTEDPILYYKIFSMNYEDNI